MVTLASSKAWSTSSAGTVFTQSSVDIPASSRVWLLSWAFNSGGASAASASNTGTSLSWSSPISTTSGDIRVTLWHAFASSAQSGISVSATHSSSVFGMTAMLLFTDTTGGTGARTSSTGSSNPQSIPGGTSLADDAVIVFVAGDANFGDASSSDATFTLTTSGGGPIGGYRGPVGASGSSTGVSLSSTGSPAWAWAAREFYSAGTPAAVTAGWGVIK